MEPQNNLTQEQSLNQNNQISKPKKKIWVIVGILILLLLVGGGYYYYQLKNKQMSLISKLGIAKLTTNEDKGVKEILDFYGGVCELSFGVYSNAKIGLTDTSSKQGKYFLIKLSKSDVLEQQKNKLILSASNIAYLFYKNLVEEKDNYKEVRVNLVLNDGKEENFVYPVEQLELVKIKMDVANKVIELIKQKDFQSLKNMIDPNKPFTYDSDEFVSTITEAESKLGAISEFIPLGFKIDEKYHAVIVAGATIRSEGNMSVSIMMSQDINDKTFYNFAYEI